LRSLPALVAFETAEVMPLLETKISGRLFRLKGDFLSDKVIVQPQ
jgi:hypothetical protein